MKLLLNTKITSQGLSYYERAEHLPKYDRMDIFKYCLASYACMDSIVTRFIFYIEIAPEFSHRQKELEAYIFRLFPADKLILHWHRNFLTADWREACERDILDDSNELIWFAGNDDHIFMDKDLKVLESGLKELSDDPDPMSVIYYSHWPEQMRLAHHFNAQLTQSGNFAKFTWRTYDGIRIIKQERFRHYWFDYDYGDTPVFRTDALWHLGHPITAPVYSPTKELVRHYDGYSHISKKIANIAPPLVIPPGFFQDNIQIRFGYPERKEGFVNINPSSEFLYAVSASGTDYRWLAGDIPKFWQNRITGMDANPEATTRDGLLEMMEARDAAFLASTRIPMSCYSIDFTEQNPPPREWFENHLTLRRCEDLDD